MFQTGVLEILLLSLTSLGTIAVTQLKLATGLLHLDPPYSFKTTVANQITVCSSIHIGSYDYFLAPESAIITMFQRNLTKDDVSLTRAR